jgi:hypothetical protein
MEEIDFMFPTFAVRYFIIGMIMGHVKWKGKIRNMHTILIARPECKTLGILEADGRVGCIFILYLKTQGVNWIRIT